MRVGRRSGLLIVILLAATYVGSKAIRQSRGRHERPQHHAEQSSRPAQVDAGVAAILDGGPRPSDRTTRTCVRVVDGDTIVLDGGEKVRLIGIDTPETVHPSKPVQHGGPEASRATKSLVEGREVQVEYDVQRLDKYRRTLATSGWTGAWSTGSWSGSVSRRSRPTHRTCGTRSGS